VLCLLLAAGAALSEPQHPVANRPPSGTGRALPPGAVAVPVTVAAGGGEYVDRGDRIGLTPAAVDGVLPGRDSGMLADHLRVLRAPTPRDDGTAVLLLAVPRADVPRLARHLDRPLLALIDPP
jgi:hypothetical protein